MSITNLQPWKPSRSGDHNHTHRQSVVLSDCSSIPKLAASTGEPLNPTPSIYFGTNGIVSLQIHQSRWQPIVLNPEQSNQIEATYHRNRRPTMIGNNAQIQLH
ncbi:hypothetical protein ACLOJK_034442 [Asimina triloba]